VHPSQLYEAGLEGLVLFTVLAICVWRFGTLKKPGMTAGVFLIGYSLSRTFLENFRAPDSFVSGLPGFLTMGMLLSIPMFLLGGWLVVRANRTPKPA
jgi:phosphatidylglycerol:prolipoprotein diacylglycerol transferase